LQHPSWMILEVRRQYSLSVQSDTVTDTSGCDSTRRQSRSLTLVYEALS
jgi:hypothetical protein